MKKMIILVSIILLSSCTISMNNEEIVQETKYCEENGLLAVAVIGGFGNTIIKCMPKE